MRDPDPDVDVSDYEDVSKDIAVFRLDKRVSTTFAMPIFPSLNIRSANVSN